MGGVELPPQIAYSDREVVVAIDGSQQEAQRPAVFAGRQLPVRPPLSAGPVFAAAVAAELLADVAGAGGVAPPLPAYFSHTTAAQCTAISSLPYH